MNTHRWHLNRAGLFNFWYYDDVTFQITDGRLIFRGPNGAGKSVTMQTFIPLVLDGDKRPSRLDPFGSKDRRIEYYLLGDGDSDIHDRIGYAYLEFFHPEKQQYLTVGIGLRARRGQPQVGFWGFAVTDGRRIGEDLFLYDRTVYERDGEKLPLDRAGLEAAIGPGGQVVREQGEYRQLVNRLLFGYADPEGFRDLLNLLIQLRSPKLSKEFRPSAVYEILNSALPPLSEEELNPLSSVLEDLDEIADRAEELERQLAAARRLHSVYNDYNELRLYEAGSRVQEAYRTFEESRAAADRAERDFAAEDTHYQEVSAKVEEAEERVRQAENRLDILEHSEAMEKHRELASLEDQLKDAVRDAERLDRRRRETEQDLEKRSRLAEENREELARSRRELNRLLERMNDLAARCEFGDHQVHLLRLTADPPPVEESYWHNWTRDVDAHRKRLQTMMQLAASRREAEARARQEEARLSEARAERDARERDLRDAEAGLEEALRVQGDRLHEWFQHVAHLPLSVDMFRTMLHDLDHFPELPYERITAPVRSALADAERNIGGQLLQLRHERRLVENERDQLKSELAAWLERREPEPPRSPARQQTRERRQREAFEKGTTAGAPLYRVCEFRDEVDEPTRAALEAALDQAGLLDAWISPEGVAFEAGDEDVFLTPRPVLFGYTLADYLRPTPPDESGLTPEQVDDVLRTILVGDDQDGDVWVGEAGTYRIGPLTGQAAGKECAEWIGYDARRRTRLEQIERLRLEIANREEIIARILEQVEQLETALASARSEAAAVPGEADLSAAAQARQTARWALDRATQWEQARDEDYRKADRARREAQRAFAEQAATWERLRREEDFEEALRQLSDYQHTGIDARRVIQLTERVHRELVRLEEEITAGGRRLEEEQAALSDLHRRRQDLEQRRDTLRGLLEEMGLLDLHDQIARLREERTRWRETERALQEELRGSSERRGALKAEWEHRKEALTQAQSAVREAAMRLSREWALRLVDLEREIDASVPVAVGSQIPAKAPEGTHDRAGTPGDSGETEDLTPWISLGQALVKRYKPRFAGWRMDNLTMKLLDVFSKEKNDLLEYVLDCRLDEELGRYFIESVQDRAQRRTPRALCEKLESDLEQQRLLIQEKERELYEQVLIHSVGRAIRDKINRAQAWVAEMNRFMAARRTSSGLVLSLEWRPRRAETEQELDAAELVQLLRKAPETLRDDELERMVAHFRSRIHWAKEEAEQGANLRRMMGQLLDYRTWFTFTLYFRKGDTPRRELTDSQFNVMSGGEKAMSMYIPLLAAADSRYKDSRPDAPRIISLDEAFAGVDDENLRDMFQLLTEMDFDYMMTSQVLWGCYDTVPSLAIYEIVRPGNARHVTTIAYRWNGRRREAMDDEGALEAAVAAEGWGS
ncbi:MAG: TIGR02680 family protein [Kyrpidia sp.]|nr:TIGR02680 family protein [Kyrpidia sp.]